MPLDGVCVLFKVSSKPKQQGPAWARTLLRVFDNAKHLEPKLTSFQHNILEPLGVSTAL